MELSPSLYLVCASASALSGLFPKLIRNGNAPKGSLCVQECDAPRRERLFRKILRLFSAAFLAKAGLLRLGIDAESSEKREASGLTPAAAYQFGTKTPSGATGVMPPVANAEIVGRCWSCCALQTSGQPRLWSEEPAGRGAGA